MKQRILDKATEIVEEKMFENTSIPEEMRDQLIEEEYEKLMRQERTNYQLNAQTVIERDECITPPGWNLEPSPFRKNYE